jgi:hypothetical protein
MTQAQGAFGTIGNNGYYVLVRSVYVLAVSLENRQSFTGLVSSNLTLSAK